MKKIIYLLMCVLFAGNACAETIIVVNDGGTVTSTFTTPSSVAPVTVARETPVAYNYYYDSGATEAVVAAGITTAVVGTLLFGHHYDKHHKIKPAPHKQSHGPAAFKKLAPSRPAPRRR